jgi:hypothetical protein
MPGTAAPCHGKARGFVSFPAAGVRAPDYSKRNQPMHVQEEEAVAEAIIRKRVEDLVQAP